MVLAFELLRLTAKKTKANDKFSKNQSTILKKIFLFLDISYFIILRVFLK